jgi:opacity protein-like surface antigen
MKDKSARVASVLFCVGSCLGGLQSAWAADPGFYVGGYLGMSSREVPRAPFDEFKNGLHAFSFFTATEDRTSFDDSGFSFGITGGYRLNQYLAFEAGYVNLGEVILGSHATGTFPGDNGSMSIEVESETSGFTASALGTLPLSRDWELFARGGALFANNKIRFSVDARGEDFVPPVGNHFSESGAKSSTDMYAGLGVSLRILEIYDARLEYQRVFDAGLDETGGEGDIDSLFLGLTVTF